MNDMGLSWNRVRSCVLEAGSTKAISGAVSGAVGGAMLVAMLVPQPANAQQADLSRCLAITDIAQRVQCYDAIAQSQVQSGEAPAPTRAPAAEPAAPAVQAQSAPRAAPAPSPALPTFGLSAAQREAQRNPSEREADEMTASVTAARQVGAGYWRFELSDGTVWELTETRRNFRIPRAGDDIKIRRGSLGAFYLDADNQPVLRIRRVV